MLESMIGLLTRVPCSVSTSAGDSVYAEQNRFVFLCLLGLWLACLSPSHCGDSVTKPFRRWLCRWDLGRGVSGL